MKTEEALLLSTYAGAMADETHDYECPEPGCGWTSTGWPTKTARDARGRQHKHEHETGEPMPELADFRKDR